MHTVIKSLAAVLVFGLSTGCLGPVAGLYPPARGEKTKTVYVLNHGWHTGLVVATDSLRPDSMPPDKRFKGKPYVEIGWGDEGFYTAQRVTFRIGAKAILWPTSTVLHCVAVERPVEKYFPQSGIVKVELSQRGFEKLRSFLAASYARDKQNKPIDLGPGIYGSSRFYRAKGKYYFPNTCNKWTVRALRAAGCPISPFYAVRAKNVFRQTAKFGTVVREFHED